MIKGNDVMVFNTKYKRMLFRGTKEGIWDLDRNDFFQINTYMSYYQNQNYNVKVSGLLYPIEEKFNEDICHSETWFGNSDTKFIVDGIDLSKKIFLWMIFLKVKMPLLLELKKQEKLHNKIKNIKYIL